MTDDITNQLEYIAPRIPHDPGHVILIGYYLNIEKRKQQHAKIEVRINIHQSIQVTISEKLGKLDDLDLDDDSEMALIQAYVFEGNLYKLPKPKIMVVSGGANTFDGTDPKESDGRKSIKQKLLYWRVNKLDRAVEITVEDGLIDQLVLEANMPGKRSPNSYAANMQLAHRSGRLTS